MNYIKKQAMMKPLVDILDHKQIVTNCHQSKIGWGMCVSLSSHITGGQPSMGQGVVVHMYM
ncbi:unnamed protein product [Spirodela intermedia]|uniref:Uncharacterized protein n=1 Tax=Spirodela intermedia TaxID=51605 RepID=A0A7I8L2I2_SPIIN|nr:unnamed protein product [Spirodela intermedia]